MTNVIIIVISALFASALLSLVQFLLSKLYFSLPGVGPKGGPKTDKKRFSVFPDSASKKDPYGEE